MKKIIFSFLFVLLFACVDYAQQTAIYKNPEAEYKTALELFKDKKYSTAQYMFLNISENIKNRQSVIKANADYYAALCGFELFNNDVEYQLNNFVKKYPSDSKAKKINFQIGKLEYQKRRYSKAVKAFEKVNVNDLTADEKTEYYFITGYCYLKHNELEKANQAFLNIKDIKSKYSSAVNYYYAHIAYVKKNYQEALQGFKSLENDRVFKKIVPYYLIQIYYLQGNYDEVINIGEPLLKGNSKKKSEIYRLVGEAYYRNLNYQKSIPFFEEYLKNTNNNISANTYYILGFAYYQNKEYKNAIDNFSRAVGENDSLAQNAFYHLGFSYLKTNEKQFASNSFLSAYKLGFDKEIKEDALFNYAKLSMELSYNPYNEAIDELKKYIAENPDSKRADEAYACLYNLFLCSKNYNEALNSLESIKSKDFNAKSDYQKISFHLAKELFLNRKYDESISFLNKALKYNFDKTITAESYYWLAEAYYRKSAFNQAVKNYKKFLNCPEAKKLEIYNTANYNMAYCFFKMKNYNDATWLFKRFIQKKSSESPKMINDAFIRLGDCYFIKNDYINAIAAFTKAIDMNVIGVDYALFQKAKALGTQSEFNKKTKCLLYLINNFKKSIYNDDAVYELAITYLLINNNDKALVSFNKIINDYPQSRYVKKSLLKSALVYYNVGKNNLALKYLKRVVEDYPNSSESKEALISMRNIYVDMNKVDEYFKYVNKQSFSKVRDTELDSITYIAAENQYMKGDCKKAIIGFDSYLKKFPNGSFAVNANYYKANCEMKNKNTEEALLCYNYVIGQKDNNFIENSLLQAAQINFDLKKYQAALSDYIELEKKAEYKANINKALIGKMRTYFLLKKYKETIKASDDVLKIEKNTEDIIIEAHYLKAKSAYLLSDKNLAGKEFKILSKLSKDKRGAEAQYYLSYFLFEEGKYKKAEKSAFALVDNFSSCDYWVAKSFILLADIYIKTNNDFQAKLTLQSIIDNYSGEDLKNIAIQKKNEILQREKSKEKNKKLKPENKKPLEKVQNKKEDNEDFEDELNDVF
ncbi:MAG: tetratricopeptide repeat protein [Bacteroidales bacterium]|nr:tetratricopeptide repeat protein [Bacteroidales bacterium]